MERRISLQIRKVGQTGERHEIHSRQRRADRLVDSEIRFARRRSRFSKIIIFEPFVFRSVINQRKYVFAQLFDILPKYEFETGVARYQGNSRVKGFTCRLQFLAMGLGKLTDRESLRNTVNCLAAHQKKFYHLGITSAVSRSTFVEVNEHRNWQIYGDFAQILLIKARHFICTMTLDLTLRSKNYG